MPGCRRARTGRAAAAIALAAALALVAGGCGDGSGHRAGATVGVSVRDFGYRVSRQTVPAGTVVLHVHNQGPSTHEMNLDRTDLPPGGFPLKPDGLTVQETAQPLRRIDSIEQLDLGEAKDLVVHLQPGHYVLWCNLEGHYLGGMHVALDVTAGRAA